MKLKKLWPSKFVNDPQIFKQGVMNDPQNSSLAETLPYGVSIFRLNTASLHLNSFAILMYIYGLSSVFLTSFD